MGATKNPERQYWSWGAGIAIGLAIGIALGASLGNIGIGIALGAGLGVSFALAFDAANGPKRRDAEPPAGGDDTPPGDAR